PDYLAPEQALDFHAADIRADIYGLGCTFFYLLTGEPPFGGGTLAQKLWRHQQAEPPAVAALPTGLAAVLRKMVAKQPADRYQTPAAVVAALDAAGQSPASALPPPPGPSANRRPVPGAGGGRGRGAGGVAG